MCFFISASTLKDVDVELALSGGDCHSFGVGVGGVDEVKYISYISSCAGDVGADGSTGGDRSTGDDGGLSGVPGPVRGASGDDGMPMLSIKADGATVDDAADASDATLADDVAPVDDGILVPLSADDADGATGILIPWLVDDADGASVDEGSVDAADGATVDVDAADGATVDAVGRELLVLVPSTFDGRISVDDTSCVSGSDADDAFVDDGSVDDADGAPIDEAISGGGELELLALVPIGGGVVDAVALIVPVGAGTCGRAPLFARVVIPRRVDCDEVPLRRWERRAGVGVDPSAADGVGECLGDSLALFCLLRPFVMVVHRL